MVPLGIERESARRLMMRVVKNCAEQITVQEALSGTSQVRHSTIRV
jgi:hypothetical protein